MSSVGIYGVTSYAVARRRKEIGIRMALGAQRRDVLGLILRQGLIRIAIGTGLGLVGALAVSRLLESVLIDVSPTDPLTFVVISVILASVTLTACLVPARKAVRLDPAEALRTE
jgi:ABC-type antimicrobial peptide transport system permease subunit